MIQVGNNHHNQNVIFDEKGIHHSLPLDFFMDRYTRSYLKEMEMFIDSLNGKDVPVGADDGVKATMIAFAARKSMEEGRPVKI